MKNVNKVFRIAALIFVSTACQDVKKEVPEEIVEVSANDEVTLTKDQYVMAGIELGHIEMRNLSNVIKANGALDVEPQKTVVISAPLGGYVKSAGLLPGQVIKKGQVIAVIENSIFIDIQQQYLESKSRLEFLAIEYKRQEDLRSEDVNSAKTFQEVRAEYTAMQARVGALEQKLELIGINRQTLQADKISKTGNLYSPITGYITGSHVTIGKYVNPTDVLFELADKSEMHLALYVFEKDIANIKVGQSIRFALASESDYTRKATVFLIGQSTSTEGTIPVHCHLENASANDLFPGMYAKALIEIKDASVAALPSDAIINAEGKDFIFIQKANAASGYGFQMIPIRRDAEEESYTAVLLPEQFDKNALVVIKGAYALLSAMKNVEE